MASEHLKFVIPGAILSGIGGLLLYIGILVKLIVGSSGYYYGGSTIVGMSTAWLIVGGILLCIGIVLLVKGINIYRGNAGSPHTYNRVAAYSPSTQVPSYAPVSAPSSTPIATVSYIPISTPTPPPPQINTPMQIQDPTATQTPSITKAAEDLQLKFCPSCGAQLPSQSHATFCPQCGAPL